MKRFMRPLVVMSLIITNIIIHAQSYNYQSGTIIDKEGIEKEVLIRSANLADLSIMITTKTNHNSEPTSYTAEDIMSFRLSQSGETFVSQEIELPDLNSDQSDLIVVKKFGLEEVEGDVSLYKVSIKKSEYMSDIVGSEPYVFIIKNGEERHQLDRFDFRSYRASKVATKKYQGLLKVALKDCPKIHKSAESTNFSSKSIKELISQYQACTGAQVTIAEENELTKASKIYHGFGLSFLSIQDNSFRNTTTFGAGYRLNLRFPRVARKLGFNLSADVISNQFDWSLGVNQSQILLRNKVQFSFYVFEREKFALSILPGLSIYNAITTTVTPSDANNFLLFDLSLNARIDKFVIAVSRESQGQVLFGIEKLYSLGLYYNLN